jgi:hypothetical protein
LFAAITDHFLVDTEVTAGSSVTILFSISNVIDYSIHPDHVINMDEVPLTCDLPMNRTVEKTGSSTINIKTTGHKKASFTCVLACTASGIHLPPMLGTTMGHR